MGKIEGNQTKISETRTMSQTVQKTGEEHEKLEASGSQNTIM